GERRAVRWVRQADGTWLAQDLGKLSPAGTLTEAHAVNDSGDVVGYSAMYYPQPYNGYEAFIWWAAKMDTLEYGRPSYAVAGRHPPAKSPKLVVGWACTQTQQACDATVPNHAWVWEKTAAGWTPHHLMTLGGSESQAHGVNDKGQVVGLSRI